MVKDHCFLESTAASPTDIAKVIGNNVYFEFACLKVLEENIEKLGCH